MPPNWKRLIPASDERRGKATALVSMLFAFWEYSPDLSVLDVIVQQLMTIARLIASAVTSSPVLVEKAIEEGTNRNLVSAGMIVSGYAINFPNLVDMVPAKARRMFKQFFDVFHHALTSSTYGIPANIKKQAVGALLEVIYSIEVRPTFLEGSGEGSIYARMLWPFIDHAEILHSINPSLTMAMQREDRSYGVDYFLQNIGCVECSQCHGEYHTRMALSEEEEIILNLDTLSVNTVGRTKNRCEICWKMMLCCTEEAIPVECSDCGVFVCFSCERRHMREHRKDERRRERERRRTKKRKMLAVEDGSNL